MSHVVIAGASTRAVAESAARAGFAVTAIDAYADLDQHPGVRALSLARDLGEPFSAVAAARAARRVDADAAVYLSNLDNHPRAVAILAAGRALWGNAPDVLHRVRTPSLLASTLRARGFAVPEVRDAASDAGDSRVRHWLRKPLASGGGHHIRPWTPGEPLSTDSYLQERIDGTPGSILFVAAAGAAVPLALSRQLVGEPAFGAPAFRYCGNIVTTRPPSGTAERLARIAAALTRAVAAEFGLVGVNGIDFIARDGVPWPIEVNPRWSGAMELVERGYGLSVFRAHAEACVGQVLPSFDVMTARGATGAVGKAIVFATRDVTAGDTHGWLADADVRDVPHPGEHIPAGRPICTVFAAADDDRTCFDALVDRAAAIYVYPLTPGAR